MTSATSVGNRRRARSLGAGRVNTAWQRAMVLVCALAEQER
jgi:hypothetical protein